MKYLQHYHFTLRMATDDNDLASVVLTHVSFARQQLTASRAATVCPPVTTTPAVGAMCTRRARQADSWLTTDHAPRPTALLWCGTMSRNDANTHRRPGRWHTLIQPYISHSLSCVTCATKLSVHNAPYATSILAPFWNGHRYLNRLMVGNSKIYQPKDILLDDCLFITLHLTF